MNRRQLATFVLLALLWGGTSTLGRALTERVPSFESTAARFLLAAILLLPVVVIRRTAQPSRTDLRRTMLCCLVLSLTLMGIPYALIFWAAQHVPSRLISVLYAALPLCITMLAPWLTGRSVPRAAWQAMIIAFGGVAFIALPTLPNTIGQIAATLAVFAAVLLQATSTLYAARELKTVSPIFTSLILLFGGGLFLAIGHLLFERGEFSQTPVWDQSALLSLALLSLFGTALAFPLYFWLLKSLEAWKLTTVQMAIPVAGIILGLLFIRRVPPVTTLAGAAIVLACVAYILRLAPDDDRDFKLGLDS